MSLCNSRAVPCCSSHLHYTRLKFNICAIPAITLPFYYSSLQHVNGRENYGISISTGRNVRGFSDHVYEEFSSDAYAEVSNQTYFGLHAPSHMHALSYHQLYIKLFIMLSH